MREPRESETTATTADSTLDEALNRLHRTGPEHLGRLSNHAPMAVEALARHGHASDVHGWIDGYRHKLEDMPPRTGLLLNEENWREVLGDPRHLGDWIAYFTGQLGERPWQDVLVTWWPRLLPGILAGATHPAIRVGHAVRTLLADGAGASRTAELGHALGYWAARHLPLTPAAVPSGTVRAAEALAAVPAVPDQEGGILDRVARLSATPGWPAAAGALQAPSGPDDARDLLAELVRESTYRYADHAHGSPVMLVHAATAPNAVLRTLPALPRDLWAPSCAAAWQASAVVTAAYAPGSPLVSPAAAPPTPEEAFERAAAHGDEHVIKFADTALDVVAADPGRAAEALAAVGRACELIGAEG
ncbi:questin oxidase family protein [Streptomyces sp. NPDC001262]|uniref:questin oxidase family protein n=1 Tax=unclassified Streptomyces TaxID=2593676 RepID=UPI0036B041AE